MAQRYICSFPQQETEHLADPADRGQRRHFYYPDDETGRRKAEQFAQQENKPGRAVYDCIGTLADGATSRCKDAVVELDRVIVDLDLKNIVEPREKVIAVLRDLPLPPNEIRDSGFGLHGVWHLKEPVCDEAGLEQAERTMKRLVHLLAGDPMPTHRAALLRRPGTDNFKDGEPRKCHVLEEHDRKCDISEFEDMFDLYSDRPLLTQKEPEKANGGEFPKSEISLTDDSGPFDFESRWANAGYKAPGKNSIHFTQLQHTGARLNQGVPLCDIISETLELTRKAVANDPRCAGWDWNEEQGEVEILCAGLINKDHTLASCLPGPLWEKFQAVVEAGNIPKVSRNAAGLHVRAYKGAASAECPAAGGGAVGQPRTSNTDGGENGRRNKYQIKRPQLEDVALGWWTPLDPAKLPPREWIYGSHYQHGVVSGTIAPGGSGKTSQCMVEAIGMATARNLLGEQPTEQCRVWYHNAEDTQDEVDRRVVAICQRYKIPQEELAGWFIATSCEKFELQVADGMNNLRIKHEVADAIAEKIHQLEIDVAIFDPLVNVHSVDESDNTKMAAVIGVFRAIAQAENCSIEIEQHTRKMPVGINSEYSGADARGASAVRDALRAQRVLNNMGKEDASRHAIPEHERGLYFRVDVGKLNNARPRHPIWRRIVNVDLANGDQVGVVEEWRPADNGDENPEVRARQEVAENMFLVLLDQFTLQGQIVSDKPRGAYYAPRLFAEEDAARQARISIIDLKAAMGRLLKARRIKFADATTRSDRNLRKIERA